MVDGLLLFYCVLDKFIWRIKWSHCQWCSKGDGGGPPRVEIGGGRHYSAIWGW